MTNIISIAEQFLYRESGQDMIEYALVAAVIGLGSVTVMSSLAKEVSRFVAAVNAAFSAAV
jgi:pilus assembly protein Flp/PilA